MPLMLFWSPSRVIWRPKILFRFPRIVFPDGLAGCTVGSAAARGPGSVIFAGTLVTDVRLVDVEAIDWEAVYSLGATEDGSVL